MFVYVICGRWVVRAEWWEMSGGRWAVRDEWWEMSVYVTCCMRWVRWVVWDVCVDDMLCERWMRWVVWDGGERWAMRDEWIEMRVREGSGVRTAIPNDIYTQQGAKLACQEDANAKFSHLLLAQLPRTQFTHSKLPNPHARKTPTQNFHTSCWHNYPEHNLYLARHQTRMPGKYHRNMFASPIGRATPNDVYAQQRYLRTASCQTISQGSEYCAWARSCETLLYIRPSLYQANLL